MSRIQLYLTIILVSIIFLHGCSKTPNVFYSEKVSINDCWFDSVENYPEAECGVLTVLENYDKPDGSVIKLPFIVLKAETPDEDKYPLVVAGGGGPGGALGITDEYADTFDYSAWYRWFLATTDVGRDLILIDNRGVGSSVPRLNCYETIEADMNVLDKKLDLKEYTQITKEAFSACRKRLIDQGVDISQYHVVNAAKDLEALRLGFGLKQLNVYGISYGTRVSLEFERRYPESVRALILDGVYPQSNKTYDNAPKQNYEAFMRIIGKCQADDKCLSQFGFDLKERLSNFLKQLEKKPVIVSVTSPVDFTPIDVVVTPDIFYDAVYSMMYDETLIAYIPKYLYSAFRGNTDYLTEMIRDYYVRDIAIAPLDAGAYVSYSCFDEIPFTDFDVLRNELKRYPFQSYSAKFVVENIKVMCEVWDVPAADKTFKDKYAINTPVLLYSGELDPVTPTSQAKSVAENAKISWEIEWPNVAHGAMYAQDCSGWTAERFLDDPESDPFVYTCSSDIPVFDFEIR